MLTTSPSTLKHTRFIVATCVLILIISGPICLFAQQRKAPYSKETLITALRKNAETRELTSSDFVTYINQRGVDFELTAVDEKQLREAGASPEIILAIRRSYRTANSGSRGSSELTIRTTPANADVLINGQARGATNDDGFLTLYSMKPGRYLVSARKDRYQQAELSVQIQTGESQMVEIALTGTPGKLNVMPTVDGASIEISNNGSYTNQVTGLELAAGAYEVTVSKWGYQTAKRDVKITPGESVNLSVKMDRVPSEDLIRQVEAAFEAKQYAQTIALGENVLAIHPDSRRANYLVGLSYYYTNQAGKGVPALGKAVVLGEEVRFPIKHRHGGPGLGLDEDMCVGEIVLRSDSLEFHSDSTTSESGQLRFSAHGFRVPFKQVYELRLNPRRLARLEVKVGVPDGNKEKKKEYDLYSSRATLSDTGVRSRFWSIVCTSCGQETQIIHQLIQQVMTAPSGSSETGSVSASAGTLAVQNNPETTPTFVGAALPTVEEVSQAYIQATGGKSALEKLSTRIMKGQYIVSASQGTATGIIEVYAKAPNKELVTVTIPGTVSVREGFDGTVAWITDAKNKTQMMGARAAGFKKRSAELNFIIDANQIRKQFSTLELKGRSKVNTQETFVLEATMPDDKPWTLYFDTQTHLLIRFDHFAESGMTQTYLEDYREVDGVRLPFLQRTLVGNLTQTIKFSEIKHNVPLDDFMFAMPVK